MKIQFCQADKRPKIRVSGVSFGPNRKLARSEEHTSELQSRLHLVCRLLLEKKKTTPHADNIGLRATAVELAGARGASGRPCRPPGDSRRHSYLIARYR